MPALHLSALGALLAVAMGFLGAPGAALAQQHEPVLGVDASVHPGDDFFSYANGEWLKASEIPAGRGRKTVRDEIQAAARQQVARLLDGVAARPMASPAARKVADYRAAFLDQGAIDARGLTPIEPLLRGIASLRNKSELARWLGSEMPADVDPMGFGGAQSSHLFGLAADKGIGGERFNVAFLVQGGLGLPDREHYLSDAAPMRTLRDKYQEYLSQLWAFSEGRSPSKDAPRRIAAVMALETAIARSHASQEDSGKEENAANLWTRADFSRQAPGMNWNAFFAGAGLARQSSFIVWQPGAVKGAASLLATQPLQVWQDYLRLRTLDRYAQVLPRAMAEAALALHGTAVAGQSAPPSRVQQADASVQRLLSENVTRLYVERYFPATHKARVDAIAARVKAVLRERVSTLDWLSPAGRRQATAKLDAVYFGLGHQDRWLDDANLQIRRDDALGNQRRIAQWRTRRALALLGQPVDPRRWALPGHDVAAGLIFTQNAYNFPAALLQAPKFDAAQAAEPDAFNFGAIGAIVGHELTHFVDTLGADYDAQGTKRRWWSAEDMAHYQAATRSLVEQFSSYRPFPDVAIDGKAGLVENFADLMGLTAAFEAYRQTLAGHPRKDDAEFVKQQDQLFFIGFARSWRAKYRDDALRKQAATDHPPESYRIATVRNLDAWYRAFDVRPEHKLWLDPKDRVRPWSVP